MLAFEVHLNGKKVCVADIGEPGMMTGIVMAKKLAEDCGEMKL